MRDHKVQKRGSTVWREQFDALAKKNPEDNSFNYSFGVGMHCYVAKLTVQTQIPRKSIHTMDRYARQYF